MSSDFAKCSWHFPHFLVENAAKHKTSMIHCLSPGFPVADQAEAPPDLAASIFPNLLWILLSKTIKIKICHFISFLFHFISLQFCSLRFIHWFIHSFLPSFIPSFLHSFVHSFIHSFMSWVCVPGFFELWGAEFRQRCPAKALWPARCPHVFLLYIWLCSKKSVLLSS